VDGSVNLQVGSNRRKEKIPKRGGDQIEKDEIGGECSTHRRVKLAKLQERVLEVRWCKNNL
jgi:hypothetical protein